MNVVKLLSRTIWYSPHQFALWRILFGVYLTYYCVQLLPYVVELYSNAGIYKIADFSWFLPHLLLISDSAAFVFTLGVLSVLCAVCILIGLLRPLAAFFLWLIQMSFFSHMPLTEDPSMAFVGLLLILLTLIPSNEPWSVDRRLSGAKVWMMPAFAYWVALLAMGVGYTVSGIDKFKAAGWQVGDALYYMLRLPITFDTWWVHLLQQQPSWLFAIETWVAGGSMLLALPLLLWRPTRPYIWLVLTLEFTGVLLIFDLTQVALAMLLFHAFIFDGRWVPAARAKRAPHTVYFDATCNLCQNTMAFIRTEDNYQRITQKPIQGSTYAQAQSQRAGGIDALVYERDGVVYERSDAMLRIMTDLGGFWRILGQLGLWVPTRLRDWMYAKVAKYRHHLFGTCTCQL